MQKQLTKDKALSRAMHYCAYQERAKKEVVFKLKTWGVNDQDSLFIINYLKEQDYLNEERFSRAFVTGKFRLKKWGRIKISIELKAKGISTELISSCMDEISDIEYKKCINKIAEEKMQTTKGKDVYVIRNKVANYLLRKGYESDLIWEAINLL